MRNKNLLFLILLTVSGQLFFGCNSAKQYQFSNNGQSYHSAKTLAKADPAELKEPAAVAQIAGPEAIPENLTADASVSVPAKPAVNLQEPEVRENLGTVVNTSEQPLVISKAQKKELRSALKQLKKQS